MPDSKRSAAGGVAGGPPPPASGAAPAAPLGALPQLDERPARVGRLTWLLRRPESGALLGTVVVFVFFAIVAQGTGFLSVAGTASWLNVCAELGIMAIPVALLMIGGEFDLSVGSVLVGSSLIVAIGTGYENWPIWVSVVVALVVAALVGLLNGILVVRTRLPSFIVTLGSQFILNGAALGLSRYFTGSSNVQFSATGSAHAIFGASFSNFNVSIFWWVGIGIIGFWVLEKTSFGNWIFATGGDRAAARNAGVRADLVKVTLFVSTALSAALVGIIQAMEFSTANVVQGLNWEFKTVIAVVVGGVLLTGGYGSIIGAFLGALTYGIADLGIFYTGWDSDWFYTFLGAILLVAVLANSYLRRKAMTSR
jgi:simple sugar transport system permease protein